MTLQAAGEPIKLSEVAIEFNAPFKVGMSELVRGGDYVPDAGGAGFANFGIPTSPPVALTDFYEGSDNPNPVELTTFILDGTTGEAKMITANELLGLAPESYNGITIPVPVDARFCIEVKFKCGPTFDPYTSNRVTSGTRVYEDADLYADVKIGLTLAQPTASFSNVISSFWGARLRYWRSDDDTTFGVVTASFEGLKTSFPEGIGFDDVRPTTSQYTYLRLSRGEDWEGSGTRRAIWKVEFFDNEFVGSPWKTFESDIDGNWPFNASGNLVFINNTPEANSAVDITVDYVRGYVGGSAPPW